MKQFLLLFLMVIVITETIAFISPNPTLSKARYARFNIGTTTDFGRATRLFAKKSRGQGFGKVKEPTAPVIENNSNEDAVAAPQTNEMVTAAPQSSNAEEIFKKYGIKDGDNQSKKAASKKATGEKAVDAPFGESVISGIPAPMQAKIEDILITLTFSALTFLILSGLGISAGALKVVYPGFELPVAFDSIIVNFLTPAFAPGLAIFLFFSVTFGLFKFAQISSNQTVYKE